MKRITIPYSVHNENHLGETLKAIGAFTNLDIITALELSSKFGIEGKDIHYDTSTENIPDLEFVLKKIGVIFRIEDT